MTNLPFNSVTIIDVVANKFKYEFSLKELELIYKLCLHLDITYSQT